MATCQQCGQEFEPGRLRGSPQKFCSAQCRRAAYWARKVELAVASAQTLGNGQTLKERRPDAYIDGSGVSLGTVVLGVVFQDSATGRIRTVRRERQS